jgi:hypothetical protein
MIERWNSGDHMGFVDELGPDVVFSPDPSFPDAGTYKGEEFRQWMRDWVATWQENHFEMTGVEEFDRAVLVDGRWHLARPETGADIPLEDFSVVYLFPDATAERPHRMAVFFDRDQAREMAVGGTG